MLFADWLFIRIVVAPDDGHPISSRRYRSHRISYMVNTSTIYSASADESATEDKNCFDISRDHHREKSAHQKLVDGCCYLNPICITVRS